MTIKKHPSPNFNDRPQDQAIDMLVLHYTGMKTAQDALERMCDPEFEVSAHYMIDEEGSCFELVPEEKRAWHAGVSYWRGHKNINDRSIGIEIVNPGHEWGYRAFPTPQIQSVISLCQHILARHPIPMQNVVAHSDIAPSRKMDPGELFPWQELADNGIGLFPFPHDVSKETLEDYGYDVSDLEKAKIAYRRHFEQQSFT